MTGEKPAEVLAVLAGHAEAGDGARRKLRPA